jgi:putative membrane protein
MPLIAQILVALVAALHLGFLVLEMALWDRPQGRRIFNTTEDFAKASKTLAANQGLYNGFLAAGLIWSLIPAGAPGAGPAIAAFFLICVIVAGIFGAATVSRRILYVQAAPALVALGALWLLPG